MDFLNTYGGIFTLILLLGVVVVNGFTDAPSSIVTSVTAKALSMKKACVLSSVFNLLGILISSFFGLGVADSLVKIGNGLNQAEICSSLITVIIFGLVTYLFGMPSSESIALLSALYGATLRSQGYIDKRALIFSLVFLTVSCVMSFALGFAFAKLIKGRKLHFRGLLISSSCLSSFIHGWQDGQKFIGLFLILSGITDTHSPFFTYFGGVISVSAAMSFGALLGGKRIVKALGEKTVKLDCASALSSEFGSFLSLLICSVLGVPVSTGNAKATSIMGAGLGMGEKINKKTATELILTSVATVPICFSAGYLLTAIWA